MHAGLAQSHDELVHSSDIVWCPRRAQAAVINLVERRGCHGTLCSIVWCSLRDADQRCDEQCLGPRR
jgi:hypothetical protein